MKNSISALLGFVLTVSIIAVAAPVATASTDAVSDQSVVAPAAAEVAALANDLEASSLPRETAGGTTTYTLDSGSQIAVGPVEDAPSGALQFSVGVGRALYVYLNQTDQKAVKTGAAEAIGLAICALPAVGEAECPVVIVVMSMASVYLSQNGICPSSKSRLELRSVGLGVRSRAMCVK